MTLSIRNFAIECRTPADADPSRARDVLDRTLTGIRRDLPRLLRQALAGEDDRNGIVFIENLTFDAVISADWSEEAITEEVGRQLLRSLWAKLSDPETLHFADEAELVARFLLHLVEGAAFTRDWHRMFEGLKMLPGSAVIRTLIDRDTTTALAALSRLGRENVEQILAHLSDADAQRALNKIATSTGRPSRDLKQIARALAAVHRRGARSQTADAEREPRYRIAFATALFRQTNTTADAVTMRIADALLAMAESSPMIPSEEGFTSAEALNNGGGRGLIATLMCSDDLGEALTILNSATVQNVSGEYMRHGGQWLLIPHVLEQTDAPAIILAALALTAGIKAPEIWRDNTLRDALGLPSDDAGILGALSVGEKREVAPSPPRPLSVQRRDVKYLQTAAAALGVSKPLLRRPMRLATYALRRYANRLPGFSHSSFPHLWGNLLSTSGTIRIGANGFFIALSPPPLDVVWRISGAGAADYRLPDGRRVIVEVRR